MNVGKKSAGKIIPINRLFENGAVDTQEDNNPADTTSDLTDAKKIAIISEAVKQHIQQNR